MTLNYGIFDSADPASPDRTYTATLLSRIVSKYLKNGIITGDLDEMAVTVTDPPAMSVIVGTGTAIVQGRFCENDAALTLSVPTAHSTYPRIDRVVVRLSAVSGRSVDVVVVAGTPAASPVSPTLTQTSETWEIPLARIAVGAGVTSILTANITDERVFPDMTNLFKAAVVMLSDLAVGGDVDITGALDVTGDVALHGQTTIDNLNGAFVGTFVGVLNGGVDSKYFLTQTPHSLTLATVIPAYSGGASGTIVDGLVAKITAVDNIPSPVCAIFNNLGATYPYTLTIISASNQAGQTVTYKTYDVSNTELSTITVDVGTYDMIVGANVNRITYDITGVPYAERSCTCAALYAAFY